MLRQKDLESNKYTTKDKREKSACKPWQIRKEEKQKKIEEQDLRRKKEKMRTILK